LLFGEKYHRWLYILSLFTIAAFLPWSKFVLGTASFVLCINWFIESSRNPRLVYYFPKPQWRVLKKLWIDYNLKPKLRLLLSRRSILILAGVLALHVIGTCWATDSHEAWRDVRIKLPLLLVPLAIGTTRPLEKKTFESLLGVFALTVLLNTICTVLIAKGYIHTKKPIDDIRNASVFISLIRLSLLAALSFFLLGRWVIRAQPIWVKLLCGLSMIWLVWFLMFMQSLTGLVIVFAGGFFLLVAMSFILQRKKMAIALLLVFILAAITGIYTFRKAYTDFYTLHPVDLATAAQYTSLNHAYEHKPNDPQIENGHPLMMYVCWYELDSSWNRRSKIPLNGGKDQKGNPIHITLLRYLTSKGWRKDAESFSKLTKEEIAAVENGATNALDAERSPLERRLYQVFWELYHFKHGADPSGNSVSMRMVLMQTALNCIEKKPFLGVGTGGQKKAFEHTYNTEGSVLNEEWRWLHAHNQFLSIAVSLGIPALLYFLYSLWYAPASMRRWRSYLYLAFFITAFLSFFDDDTLETMQGVYFFVYFNSLLLYAMPRGSAVEPDFPSPELADEPV
jgi:O-Antigen ligase